MGFIPVCTPLLDGNELEYVTDAVSTGWISSSGSYVSRFEAAFAEYCGVKHGVAVCNGTVALHLALCALGVGPGDEVVIPDFTMISSAFAVCYTGATPVYVDACKNTWNIDPLQIEAAISERTKAIMPVHIFGSPCDMDAISAIAQKHGIALLEDAAEAHGARHRGRQAGALSDIAAFSFFANKNITTGEGGMVVTDSDELAERARYFKNVCFGLKGERDYLHHDIGFNYRMSNLHAAIGLAQTEKAEQYREMRVKNGLLYRELLSDVEGISLQKDIPETENVFWMNGVLLDPERFGCSRSEVMHCLRKEGIDSRVFFNGMHRQPALEQFFARNSGTFPVTDLLAENGFYLPSASLLTDEQVECICSTLKQLARC